MIGEFIFNNIPSSTYNLVCKSIKRPLLPARKLKRVELTSTSGAYDFNDYEYSLREVIMRITYIGTNFNELRTRARNIAAWLSTPTWSQLIINDEPNVYYLAKVTNEIELASIWQAGEIEITFDCQPFAYSVNKEIKNVKDIVSNYIFEFINPGNREINYRSPQNSESKIIITGSWSSISLTMNGKTLNYAISTLNKTMIIDNILMEATLNNQNIFGNLTGDIDDFLLIVSGENKLYINGVNLNIEASISYIPLWI